MDGLCLRSGLAGISPSVSVTGAAGERRANPSQCSAGGRSPVPANVISVFKYPFRSLLFGAKQRLKGVALDDAVLVEGNKEREECKGESEGQNGNWVLKILHVKSLWSEKEEEEEEREKEEENVELNREDLVSSNSSCDEDEKCDVCRVCGDDDEKGNVVFDRDLFSKMLKKVSLAEAKLYAHMSYLGNLAYSIPSIKPGNLLKRHGLRYVTSSIEKREHLASFDKKEQPPSSEEELSSEPETSVSSPVDTVECEGQKDETSRTRASAAFEIAASAASYLHSGTRSMLPFRGSKTKDGENLHDTVDGGTENVDINSEMASLMATTDSVTAVVAAKEEVKQAVADDLNSMSSSPCEWYICDDDQNATRFFVIQGSESLSSWQANLLFEPVQFEGMDVFVHRGIYEAAKGIYQQMLPEVHAHLKSHGKHARFRFTGHSLGGSLSLLISLMLLIRGEVPSSSLLPVITFGSPHVMCGGDDLLRQLGLPRNYVQAVTMHRDIVPRAFSCNYPRPAAQILKAVNGNFRNHPCLNNQKLLYAPMGELLILQPDSNFSPQHDLLPSGSGLYLLNSFTCDDIEPEKLLRAAKLVFLNNPHPLEILSDRSSYGNDGAILRDHDMRSYLKTVRGVIRHELNRIRKAHRERRTKVWWPHVTPRLVHAGVVLMGTASFGFSGAVRTGRESLKRFSRLIASQHMHMLVVLIGAYSVIGFR